MYILIGRYEYIINTLLQLVDVVKFIPNAKLKEAKELFKILDTNGDGLVREVDRLIVFKVNIHVQLYVMSIFNSFFLILVYRHLSLHEYLYGLPSESKEQYERQYLATVSLLIVYTVQL